MISMLKTGKTGEQILAILDSLISEDTNTEDKE